MSTDPKANAAAAITSALSRLDAAVASIGERVDMSADSTNAKLDALVDMINGFRADLEAVKRSASSRPANTNGGGGSSSGGGGGGKYAPGSDADLDGKYGDPVIDRKPPRWDGDFTPGPMSKQTPEFLRSFAGFQEWRARKALEEGKENKYAERDAARARAWADRLERGEGFTPRPVDGSGKPRTFDDTPPADEADFMDEIPF
jgi:hypothetical protein